jgi:hypothetical protein
MPDIALQEMFFQPQFPRSAGLSAWFSGSCLPACRLFDAEAEDACKPCCNSNRNLEFSGNKIWNRNGSRAESNQTRTRAYKNRLSIDVFPITRESSLAMTCDILLKTLKNSQQFLFSKPAGNMNKERIEKRERDFAGDVSMCSLLRVYEVHSTNPDEKPRLVG